MWFGMWEEISKIFLPYIFMQLQFDCLRLVMLIYTVEITWLSLSRSFCLYMETSVTSKFLISSSKIKEAYSTVLFPSDHLNM